MLEKDGIEEENKKIKAYVLEKDGGSRGDAGWAQQHLDPRTMPVDKQTRTGLESNTYGVSIVKRRSGASVTNGPEGPTLTIGPLSVDKNQPYPLLDLFQARADAAFNPRLNPMRLKLKTLDGTIVVDPSILDLLP